MEKSRMKTNYKRLFYIQLFLIGIGFLTGLLILRYNESSVLLMAMTSVCCAALIVLDIDYEKHFIFDLSLIGVSFFCGLLSMGDPIFAGLYIWAITLLLFVIYGEPSGVNNNG